MNQIKREPDRVLHVFGGMELGGAETRTMEIYRKINKDKVQFDFLGMFPGEHYYDKEIMSLGGRILTVNHPKNIGVISFILEVKSTILKYGPFKAIHAHTSFNIGLIAIAAKLADVKIIIAHSRTSSNKNPNGIVRKSYFFMMRFFINRLATYRVACGLEAAKFLYGEKIGAKKNYVLLKNAIDYDKFINLDRNRIRDMYNTEFGFLDNVIKIGHIGNFRAVKNHTFLIELANYLVNEKKMCNFKLLMIGDGELKEEIQKKIDRYNLGNYVYILGRRSDIPELLSYIDVFLLPSIYEGVPGVLLESQMSGTPAIVSDSITRETDLGIDLISYLNINSNYESWFEKIISNYGKKNNNELELVKALKKNRYDIETSISKLYELYDIKS